jgi:hypothetical protein
VVDSPLRLVVIGGGALVQTESFINEMERRAQAIVDFKSRIIQ